MQTELNLKQLLLPADQIPKYFPFFNLKKLAYLTCVQSMFLIYSFFKWNFITLSFTFKNNINMGYLYGKFTFLCVPKINGFALTLLKHVFIGLLCILGQWCLKKRY